MVLSLLSWGAFRHAYWSFRMLMMITMMSMSLVHEFQVWRLLHYVTDTFELLVMVLIALGREKMNHPMFFTTQTWLVKQHQLCGLRGVLWDLKSEKL